MQRRGRRESCCRSKRDYKWKGGVCLDRGVSKSASGSLTFSFLWLNLSHMDKSRRNLGQSIRFQSWTFQTQLAGDVQKRTERTERKKGYII
jgi:hypothetical protein